MPDLWMEHVANGEAFSAENFVVPGGGLIAHVQILNPVDSGKRIRLYSSNVTAAVAITGTIRRHDPTLTVLGLPAGFIVENLLAGGQSEVAEMRSDALGALVGTVMWQFSAPPTTPALFPPGGREWGFELLEGQGLVWTGPAAAVLIVNLQWVEVPVL